MASVPNSSLRDSELILNSDGSVYHLGLSPEQVTPVIITVGDPERVAQVSKHFDHIEYQVQHREFCTHIGRFAERRIMCISTGIGTDNVDIVLNELDALANIDFASRQPRSQLTQLTFLRLGTSGTFQADIPVDRLLASEAAIGLDGLGPFYEFPGSALTRRVQSRFPHFAAAAYSASGDTELLSAWKAADSTALQGITLTCAGFYGPQRRSLRLPFTGPSLSDLAELKFDGNATLGANRLTNFEMETAGIYGLSKLLGHRALSVSAILANRATGEFSQRPAQTVDGMIQTAFHVLRKHAQQFWRPQ